MPDAPDSLFREEAIEHHARGQRGGDVLRITPRWTRWTYWVLVAAVVSAIAYGLLGTIHQYASGPATIVFENRSELAVRVGGTVESVEVGLGDSVAQGDVLAYFHRAEERAQLESIEREYDLQLKQLLRSPGNEVASQSLLRLEADRELAQARLEERVLRAPHAGTVTGLRIRPGQAVRQGEVVVSLAQGDPQPTIVAMLPGHFRPQLEVGMEVRMEIAGYQYSYQQLAVSHIEEEVVSPTTGQRYLPAGISDAIQVTGPVVLVYSKLPSLTFESDDQQYAYHEGMLARAEVRVRSEPILVALVPALRKVIGQIDG